MKKTFILLFVLLNLSGVYAQTGNNADMDKAILQQANDMGKKFIAKDYAGFLKYSHPTVIKSMGGEGKTLEKTKKEFENLEAEGITFLTIKYAEPSKIIAVDNERQCIITQIIEMRITGGKYTISTPLIAISPDKGKNWHFIDTSGNNFETMRLLVPTLSDDLVIPPPQDPSFEEDPKPE